MLFLMKPYKRNPCVAAGVAHKLTPLLNGIFPCAGLNSQLCHQQYRQPPDSRTIVRVHGYKQNKNNKKAHPLPPKKIFKITVTGILMSQAIQGQRNAYLLCVMDNGATEIMCFKENSFVRKCSEFHAVCNYVKD